MSRFKKMTPEVKEAWLTALRSGEYMQGRGGLKSMDESEVGYCCLGVLCEIASKTDEKKFGVFSSELESLYLFDGKNGGYPTGAVYNWSALDSNAASVLVNMNDVNKSSFEEIAEWVDTNL